MNFLIKRCYLITFLIFCLSSILFSSSKIDNKQILNILQQSLNDNNLSIENYHKYFDNHSLYEYIMVLTTILYGKESQYSDIDFYSDKEKKENSIFLICLKDWMKKNDYDFTQIKILESKELTYSNNYKRLKSKILFGKKILIYYFNNDNKENVYKIDEIMDNTDEVSIINKMIYSYKKLPYKIIASSERKEYPISYISDGEQRTAWVAGKNKGIGENISLKFFKKEYVKHIYIHSGYVKNDLVFKANNRVKEIEIKYNNITKKITLQDKMPLQFIPIEDEVNEIKITILDIYNGDKYPDDTCISELGAQVGE